MLIAAAILTSLVSAATCRNITHVLLMLNAVAFGGALIAYVVVVVALRLRRIRARAADPYVAPFGDVPDTRSSLAFHRFHSGGVIKDGVSRVVGDR